jgi:transcription antitermination factor NusA-like protein
MTKHEIFKTPDNPLVLESDGCTVYVTELSAEIIKTPGSEICEKVKFELKYVVPEEYKDNKIAEKIVEEFIDELEKRTFKEMAEKKVSDDSVLDGSES